MSDMSYWSDITRNLIMQNSGPVRQQGGDLGMTTWAYVVGKDGVKTIDPTVTFYLHPPPNSRCRWSTDHGRFPASHVVTSNDGSEDGMPPRELVDWNDDIIQTKVEQHRSHYWEDLKYLVRPNTFEDLYELFDSATLWYHGAYNLWKLVNALVTLAHDQFPYVLQDWKDYIEKVVHEVFRAVTDSRLVRHNNNMQVLHNQNVLISWDRTVDPLVLLQHTSFPSGGLSAMNVQQHGLLRELLVCEHIRLTGTQSPIPQYYNYPRPIVHTIGRPAPDFVDNQLRGAPVHSAVRTQPSNTVVQVALVNPPDQQPKSPMPLVVVSADNHSGQLETQAWDTPTRSGDQVSSITVTQSPVLSSPSSAPLPSIPEEAINNGEVIHKGVIKKSTFTGASSPEATPTHIEGLASEVAVREAVPITDTNTAEAEAAVPNITTKEATPPPDSPIRDRKDSNGSNDELFFPDAPSDKLHVGRQRSVASAPDQDTESLLTIAEKNSLAVSETPPAMQARCDRQYYASTAKIPTSQGPLRFPTPSRNQGRQQSRPMGYQMQTVPQYGFHTGPSSPHTLQMVPPFGPPNVMLRGHATVNQSPPNMRPGSNGAFIPNPPRLDAGPGAFSLHCGIPPAPGVSKAVGLSVAPPIGVQSGPYMMPSLQHQMPPYLKQPLDPHGPPMNASFPFMDRQSQWPPGYQPNGHFHPPRKYSVHGEHGDNGYSNNGYRNSNNNGGINSQYSDKRRDSSQSNETPNNRTQSISSFVKPVPCEPGVGPQGRGLSNANRPDQNRVGAALSQCKNANSLRTEELFEKYFVDCSCVRCEESSRSVCVRIKAQNNKLDGELLQKALLKHFAQFNPVGVKTMGGYVKGKVALVKRTCFVAFQNGTDIARIVHWSSDPLNDTIPGVTTRISVWYPLYSKHYVPQMTYGSQSRYPSHSPVEHSRRDSKSYRQQQPVETLSMWNGYNGPAPTQSFLPPDGMVYQQVQPHTQPRVLYDPKAPQRRDSKLQKSQPNKFRSEQKLVATLGYSQDVRKSRSLHEGSWRQPQTKLTSEEALADSEDDAVGVVEDTPGASTVKDVETSPLIEGSSARVAISFDSDCDSSPGVDLTIRHLTQAGKPPKQQHLKEKPSKNEPWKYKSDQNPTDDRKTNVKGGNTSVAGARAAISHTTRSSQGGSASADEPETSEKSFTSSSSTDCQTTNPVQQECVSVGQLQVIDGDSPESTISSRTLTPDTVRPFEYQTAAHYEQSSLKDNTVHEKPIDRNEAAAGLASPIEIVGVDTVNANTLTSGYNMTTNQLSSAVEDVGYSTQTVVRHKPGRPALPSQWADAGSDDDDEDDNDDEARAGKLTPTEGIQTGSAFLNRIQDVDLHMTGYHCQELTSIFTGNTAQGVMATDIGNTIGDADALVANGASASSAASIPKQADTFSEGPASIGAGSTITSQEHSKPARSQRHKNKSKKKKKKKVQDKGSHLASRPESPTDLQSRGSSPPLDRSLSANAFSNKSWRGPSTVMQGNEEDPSEGAISPKVNNKQAKNKWKRKLPVTEVSDELGKSGASHDDKRQDAGACPSSQKTEASQDVSAEKSAPQLASTIVVAQSLPTESPSRNAGFCSENTGGSLRMPKTRSPKQGSQKKASQSTTKNKASSKSEATSLESVAKSPTKEGRDVHAQEGLTVDRTFTTAKVEKPTPPEMSFEKPGSQSINLKAAKSNDPRVALPKVALPPPQINSSAKSSCNWASIAKRTVSHAPEADKRAEHDPFADDKEPMTSGGFIKGKNVKSLQKPMGNYEKTVVSRDSAFPKPSPEKQSRRPDTTAKSQLNAAVQSFNPSASCTSSAPSTKPKLNPNAAAFSLSSSPSQSATSALAPGNGRMGRDNIAANMKENETPFTAQRQMPLAELNSIKKGHAKKPSLVGHKTGADKRFITPAEQVLDSKKLVQPPSPSKESKRTGPIPDRSSTTGKGPGSTTNPRRKPADDCVADEPKTGLAHVYTAEQTKNIKTTSKNTGQITGDVSAGLQSTSCRAVSETRSNSEVTMLDAELFPTLGQAAAVSTTKKRRTVSIAKAGLTVAATVGQVSGTVVGRDINGSSQKSGSDQTQKDGAKTKRILAPNPPAAAVARTPRPNFARNQTNTQGNEPKQPADKDSWQTVAPKQKNSCGTNKGQGSRAVRYGSLRSARGGRGGRGGHEGATEERKGG